MQKADLKQHKKEWRGTANLNVPAIQKCELYGSDWICPLTGGPVTDRAAVHLLSHTNRVTIDYLDKMVRPNCCPSHERNAFCNATEDLRTWQLCHATGGL